MIVGAEPRFYDMFPKHAQPDTTVPYVMWYGTLYQHLMIPCEIIVKIRRQIIYL